MLVLYRNKEQEEWKQEMRKFEERMEALRGDLKKERDKSQKKNIKDISEVRLGKREEWYVQYIDSGEEWYVLYIDSGEEWYVPYINSGEERYVRFITYPSMFHVLIQYHTVVF
jgi:methylase of polypeptide subunit release factors